MSDFVERMMQGFREIRANIDRLKSDLATERAARDRAEARVTELESSILRHFNDEHLAGDGPEIDRVKRKAESDVARLTEDLAIARQINDARVAEIVRVTARLAEERSATESAEHDVTRLRGLLGELYSALQSACTTDPNEGVVEAALAGAARELGE